ncbi:nucleotidyltransferase domain-containing protein [Candidatus Methylomirabilis sp.]|uniref:nucleotidyltransferase domain-containing protein n=1 Tax=Candidatus Methylomirabilis sp. TaxID=2032687 RepID=UPI003076196D
MKLTSEELVWLNAYRMALVEQFPGLVDDILIFGSKARGDAGPDSDLDVLIILREGDRNRKRAVRHIGHSLAILSEVVPSIMVYTREEWALRRHGGSPFYGAVVRDGVRVA